MTAGLAVASHAPPFPAIDWSRPWFADVAAAGQAASSADDWRAGLCRAAASRGITTAAGLPLRFVPQSALPCGESYEAFIAATGCVPTRDNLHDFFNALIWLTFPRAKAALNARQAAAIAADGIGATRGSLRDAATLFDENAALFVTADPALADALRGFDWSTLFLARRQAWGRATEVAGFGHALLEKLVTPYKSVTAHAWIVPVDRAYFEWPRSERCAWLDAQLTRALAHAPFTSHDFAPLPVLGVPGWCQDNDAPEFYADTAVFRPGRRRRVAAC
ncbi:membrane protein [Pandoraea terrae]|uniref:Membrane protein n=1 Tax=Pandoraea terrae TaxID=1537710 RepID=A0A5E4TZF8_9BURK|nr:DUF3025 domain-containing protein [Pandoraea terrae]VVD93225.1 membrane protein [Pandoraea terrae]